MNSLWKMLASSIQNRPDATIPGPVLNPSLTQLSPQDEEAFQQWHANAAKEYGTDPNPDSPEHHYDYRGAFKGGAQTTFYPKDSRWHWPSEFKLDGHPHRFLKDKNGNTYDTKYEDRGDY